MLVTNIQAMTTVPVLATRERLADAALDLFEAKGYERTTVNDIATACGLSHMTFFRHFPTKESVLLDDPYDPAIAAAVAGQPTSLPPIHRVARGFLLIAKSPGDSIDTTSRRRIAIAAAVPELRSAVIARTRGTEDAIVEACSVKGDDPLATRVATAACLAAVSVALVDWATSTSGQSLAETLTAALVTVVPALGTEP